MATYGNATAINPFWTTYSFGASADNIDVYTVPAGRWAEVYINEFDFVSGASSMQLYMWDPNTRIIATVYDSTAGGVQANFKFLTAGTAARQIIKWPPGFSLRLDRSGGFAGGNFNYFVIEHYTITP
jgi:hypothetical protein